MRNPRKRRNISAAIGVVAGVILGATLALNRSESELGAWFSVVVVAAHITLLALVGFIVFHANHRMQQKLERGDRLLAKWTLSAVEWQTFAADENLRKTQGRHNNFKIRRERLNSAVNVFIAENAIMIDDDFYHLGRMRGLQWLPDTLPCLEYNMVTAGKSGSVQWNVRIPVPPYAETQARLVWDYVHRPGQGPDALAIERRFKRMRVGGFVVAIICTPALIFVIDRWGQNPVPPLFLYSIFIGMIGVPAGLFAGILSHFMLRARTRKKPPVPEASPPPA